MDEVASVQRQVMLRAAAIALILAVFAVLFGRWSQGLSVVAGCTLAILNFRLIALGIIRILELDTPRAAQAHAVIRYIIRYAIAIGFLYWVSIDPNMDLLAAVVGLLLVKAAILGEVILTYIKQQVLHFLNPARWERGES